MPPYRHELYRIQVDADGDGILDVPNSVRWPDPRARAAWISNGGTMYELCSRGHSIPEPVARGLPQSWFLIEDRNIGLSPQPDADGEFRLMCRRREDDASNVFTIELLEQMRRIAYQPAGREERVQRLAINMRDSMIYGGHYRFTPHFEQEYELSYGPRRSPSPAERENALRLLETVVGEENIDESALPGRCAVDVSAPSGNKYRLLEGAATVLHKIAKPEKWWRERGRHPFGCYERRLLCYELDHSYHPIDTMIAEILLIQTDEDKYLETAN